MEPVEKKRLDEICATLQELARMARSQKKLTFYAHLVDARELLEVAYGQPKEKNGEKAVA